MQNRLQKKYYSLREQEEKLLEDISPLYHYLWEIPDSDPIKKKIRKLKENIKELKESIYYERATPLQRLEFNLRNSKI